MRSHSSSNIIGEEYYNKGSTSGGEHPNLTIEDIAKSETPIVIPRSKDNSQCNATPKPFTPEQLTNIDRMLDDKMVIKYHHQDFFLHAEYVYLKRIVIPSLTPDGKDIVFSAAELLTVEMRKALAVELFSYFKIINPNTLVTIDSIIEVIKWYI